MPEFKFQIGELVYSKAALADCELFMDLGELQLPKAAMVIEQLTQTCPGGTQLRYSVALGGQVSNAHEIELLAASEFDKPAFCMRWVAAKAKQAGSTAFDKPT